MISMALMGILIILLQMHAVGATATLAKHSTRAALDANLIPRIDLRRPAAKLVQDLQKAAAADGPGFFYLVNHGIPETVFDNTIREARKFHTLSASKKLQLSAVGYGGGHGSTKGYVPPNTEGSYAKDTSDVRPEVEQASGKPNTRESLVFRYPEEQNVSKELYCIDYDRFLHAIATEASNSSRGDVPLRLSHAGDKLIPMSEVAAAARRFFLPNRWPDDGDLPDFRAATESYFQEMRRLAYRMFHLFSEVLKEQHSTVVTETVFRSINSSTSLPHDKAMVTYNMVRYPPSSAGDDAFGIADHTDWEAFTLLYPTYLHDKHLDWFETQHSMVNGTSDGGLRQEGNPNIDPASGIAFTGLEVWFRDRWVAVPHVPGAIIVNQGEMLSRLSGGMLKAPVHRVLAHNDFERYSLVSFWAPNYDAVLPDSEHDGGWVAAGEHYLRRNGLFG